MSDPYSDEEIGGLGSGPRYPQAGAEAERARFALIANAAEQIAKDAAKDPGGYTDGGEGFRWAAEHIRQAIKETE